MMELFFKIATSILEGFGIYSLFYIIVGSSSWRLSSKDERDFDDFACELVAKVGALFLIAWLLFLSRKHLTGPYWLATWIPFILVMSSQTLWLKRLRAKAVIRVLVAFCLLISVEDVIIRLTALHRDYLPSTWSSTISSWLVGLVQSLAIFLTSVLIFWVFTSVIQRRRINH